jgi:uncharacterized protein YndB with AHSA1/START domain
MIVPLILKPDPKLDLVLERVIDVPRKLVWRAWTEPEHIVKWFTPAPWQTIRCELDLRPGGKFHFVMRSPEGQDFPHTGCFLEVTPEQRLIWTDTLLPGYRPAENPFFTAAVTLEALGAGKTRYVAMAIHGSAANTKKHADMGFHDGWGKALDQLVAGREPPGASAVSQTRRIDGRGRVTWPRTPSAGGRRPRAQNDKIEQEGATRIVGQRIATADLRSSEGLRMAATPTARRSAKDAIPAPEKVSIGLTVNGAARQLDVAPWTSRRDARRGVSIADAMRHGKVDRFVLEKTLEPTPDATRARNTHSAVFAEVRVDEQLGVVRVTRVVEAVAAGRILNPKTARGQILGSVVMGIGMALHEETLVDHRFGRIVNADFAGYHVPVNADIHDIRAIFADEPDALTNPLGLKGVGEIGIVGVAAAIANAVYHATGTRVRDLPITLDKLTA